MVTARRVAQTRILQVRFLPLQPDFTSAGSPGVRKAREGLVHLVLLPALVILGRPAILYSAPAPLFVS